MAEVTLRNVCKIYDNGFEAVKGISFDIKDREFIVLVGPSGCGKSTTLRMIAGLETISKGEVTIDEDVINEMPPKDRNIAMVFQNYALYPHMTVYNNLAFGLKLKKVPKDVIDEKVKNAAEILGISHLLNNKPKLLSGGQRQRVAVGRAIVRDPKVFLFDEPLSNLDAKLRVQMRTEISKLHAKLNATMIYVTHDQTEAMTMADRIVVMKDGVIQQLDTPLNLYHKPVNKFVAGFIGSPHMNFFKGKITKNDSGDLCYVDEIFNVKIASKQQDLMKDYNEKEIWMGVRPEDIYDVEKAQDIKEWQKITAKVEVIEPMGSEIYVDLYHPSVDSSTNCFIAREEPFYQYKVGEEVEMIIDMSKTRFFDVETEEIIK